MHSLVATSYLNSIEPGSFARLLSFPLDSTIPFFVGYVHSRARWARIVPHRASLIRYYLVVPYRLQFAMRVARDNDILQGVRETNILSCAIISIVQGGKRNQTEFLRINGTLVRKVEGNFLAPLLERKVATRELNVERTMSLKNHDACHWN